MGIGDFGCKHRIGAADPDCNYSAALDRLELKPSVHRVSISRRNFRKNVGEGFWTRRPVYPIVDHFTMNCVLRFPACKLGILIESLPFDDFSRQASAFQDLVLAFIVAVSSAPADSERTCLMLTT